MEIKRGIGFGIILILGWIAACSARVEERLDLGAVSSEKELVNVGQKIFFGKGQCALCHTLGGEGRGKCPDLAGAGARLTREFLYETLTKPEAYIKLDFDSAEPKKYPARMPTVNKPPIGLSEQELLTVIAFVQSQGGAVTVRPAEVGQKNSF
ncbi:MAG: cytochrome c [Nitrospirae bacterium]|nr:cytochrome c [Candidatus Manganitrophaceae bacterium]